MRRCWKKMTVCYFCWKITRVTVRVATQPQDRASVISKCRRESRNRLRGWGKSFGFCLSSPFAKGKIWVLVKPTIASLRCWQGRATHQSGGKSVLPVLPPWTLEWRFLLTWGNWSLSAISIILRNCESKRCEQGCPRPCLGGYASVLGEQRNGVWCLVSEQNSN